eukprot:8895165-Alexandrium_andersonii.AAC.1
MREERGFRSSVPGLSTRTALPTQQSLDHLGPPSANLRGARIGSRACASNSFQLRRHQASRPGAEEAEACAAW